MKILASAPQEAYASHLDDRTRGHFVVIARRGLTEPMNEIDHDVRMHLAHQRCVIVTGECLDGPSGFYEEEIESVRGALTQRADWQGEIFFWLRLAQAADVQIQQSLGFGQNCV